MKQRNKRNRATRDTPSPSYPTPKKANTKGSTMAPPPKPSLSSSADKTIYTEKTTPEMATPTKSPPASTTSPVQSPVANLSKETQDGAGWCNDQDNRPKPIRHKFSELKALDCQVYTDSMNHLSRVIDEDDPGPTSTCSGSSLTSSVPDQERCSCS